MSLATLSNQDFYQFMMANKLSITLAKNTRYIISKTVPGTPTQGEPSPVDVVVDFIFLTQGDISIPVMELEDTQSSYSVQDYGITYDRISRWLANKPQLFTVIETPDASELDLTDPENLMDTNVYAWYTGISYSDLENGYESWLNAIIVYRLTQYTYDQTLIDDILLMKAAWLTKYKASLTLPTATAVLTRSKDLEHELIKNLADLINPWIAVQ